MLLGTRNFLAGDSWAGASSRDSRGKRSSWLLICRRENVRTSPGPGTVDFNYLAGGGEVGSHVALRAGEDRHYVNTEITETTESNQISLSTPVLYSLLSL